MRPIPYYCIAFLCFAFPCIAFSQINFTANDKVPAYNGHFAFGTNMSYYAPWTDEQLADITVGNPEHDLNGVGVNALRPSLPHHFLEQWGYDIRINTFKHYQNLGVKENVIFIGFPAPDAKETTVYCQQGNEASHHFKDLYTPIWDGGANGTPVNDNNPLALYVYETVTRYKDFARYWEIWNEPDFDYSGNSLKAPGQSGNWWDNDPDPCHYKMKAPIQHYIRTLRICYEVIKYITPESYVAVGGLGYPSFLDAILRNSDNPDNGNINNQYPLRGGAYFDVLSFHSYPHIDGSLREWDNPIMNFSYKRHSDEAVKGVFQKRDEFRTVLENYGYNGADFPRKKWIITEANIPAKQVGDFIGSDDAQVNFLIKCLVKCMMEDILQFDVYNLAEGAPSAGNSEDFKRMGLFKNLTGVPVYQCERNPAGLAYKTTSDLLYQLRYNQVRTTLLRLPENIDGGVFTNDEGQDVYVLWAKTNTDQSEQAHAQYKLPESLKDQELYEMDWKYAQTKSTNVIPPGGTLLLNGSPKFYTTTDRVTIDQKAINIYPNPFVDSTLIQYYVDQPTDVKIEIYDLNGNRIKLLHQNPNQDSGWYAFSWNDNDLVAGVYYINLVIGFKKHSKKVIKLYR